MAEHGEVEYATATGNDYATHEQMYETFMQIVVLGICHVINVVLALTIGAVLGHWVIMTAIIVVASVLAVQGLASGAKLPSAVMVVISALALAFCAS